eukprot:Plantae.Rhodophyta-Hildenbrandia_rubra.ctg506.p1 GENE.Plantae.Rhodophyta-Hildenbrandia_rubra.ctg506~~Plantae.Rhodophyta-Hildenbrandia_rubra.ctg506.p1  ORF type:complete len:697 (+),score=185.49 Plantae.Rhodophyta-Hildenbrandia_rubra.ctg506:3421-5511(+)
MDKDARFAVRDARFRGSSKRKTSGVELDERFKKQLRGDGFAVRRRVDRYGRSIRRDGRAGYGRHTETDMEVADAKRMFGLVKGDSDEEKVENGDVSESSDEESFAADGEEEAGSVKEEEGVKRGKATERLAVLGLDWDHAKAVDLLACFKSFCPAGDSVLKVAIHPSDYGMEQMEKEKQLGPVVMNRNNAKLLEQAQTPDLEGKDEAVLRGKLVDDDTDAGKERRADEEKESESDVDSDSDDDSDLDSVDLDPETVERKSQAALREYEENRTKYYYAVAELSSSKAGSALYDELDGLEYSVSGRAFDLRFIPADFKIPHPPRDVATSLPMTYKPPALNPSTLNNSTVRLMWDADRPDRVKLRKKSFTKEEIESMDLQAYLGSDSDSDEEDGEEKAARINRIRGLLLNDEEKRDGDKHEDSEIDGGMEVTFEPGLEEKGEDILRRKKEKERRGQETVGDVQNRKRQEARLKKLEKWKEERKLSKIQSKESESVEVSDQEYENPFDGDPFFTADPRFDDEKRVAREEARLQQSIEVSNEKSDAARRKAALELVMMDEKPVNEHRKAAAVESDEDEEAEDRRRRKKKTRGKRRRDRIGKKPESSFVPNIEDPRFKQVLEGREFTLDPTHPKFAKSETNKRLLKAKHKKGDGKLVKDNKPIEAKRNMKAPKDIEGKARSLEVLRLAAKLKSRGKTRRAKQ